jgi:hypothetical protein
MRSPAVSTDGGNSTGECSHSCPDEIKMVGGKFGSLDWMFDYPKVPRFSRFEPGSGIHPAVRLQKDGLRVGALIHPQILEQSLFHHRMPA